MWVKLVFLFDDGDVVLDFWIDDGSNYCRLIDYGLRGKWNMLMNVCIFWF